jgi:hypothetical protein
MFHKSESTHRGHAIAVGKVGGSVFVGDKKYGDGRQALFDASFGVPSIV